MNEKKIAIFRNKKIRREIYKNEWWFSVVDIIEILTGTDRPRKYWSDLKSKLIKEGYREVSEKIGQLKLEAPDGKMRETDCGNTETIFRIVQSIPSPKAEPFKRWLAKVGYERVEEINDPELAQKRARMLYKIKGYPDAWIERRIRSIAIREELTDEWKKHGVSHPTEYEILTAEIAKAAFGVTPSQHKNIKGLKRENLRDHMTEIELLLSMLGETATKEITKTILVDAVDAFVIEGKGVFKEMHDFLETFPNRKIILTGANDEQFKMFGLDKMPYEVFTLKHNPEKIDPKYYETTLKHFGLSKDDVIYFEHNPEAVKSAETVGIKSYYYDPEKKDLDALKNFLTENL